MSRKGSRVPFDDAALRRLFHAGATCRQIATALEWTESQVKRRLEALGLRRRAPYRLRSSATVLRPEASAAPVRLRCLCCGGKFESVDKRANRLCRICSARNDNAAPGYEGVSAVPDGFGLAATKESVLAPSMRGRGGAP